MIFNAFTRYKETPKKPDNVPMVTSGGHKLPATLLSLVSKQVLVTIGDNDTPRHTVVDKVSPNGLYVNFASDRAEHEHIGWVKVSDVKVLDVF